MRRWLLTALLLLPLPAAAATYDDYTQAILQGLDKVTGRVATLTVPVGTSVEFGDLTVLARACKKTPPEELPEVVAFLEISAPAVAGSKVKGQERTAQDAKLWYSGWMFASDPSLAALEHPVYDVTVVDCKGLIAPPEAPADKADTTPAPDSGASPKTVPDSKKP